MDLTRKAQEFFRNDLFATLQAGIEIVEARENYAKCSMMITANHKNAVGAVMGGAIFTLADFAFAVACNVAGKMTVSVTSQINFIASAKGNELIAETRLIKDGKRTCFYSVDITDAGKLVATVAITGQKIGE